jgi:hypothetical protein
MPAMHEAMGAVRGALKKGVEVMEELKEKEVVEEEGEEKRQKGLGQDSQRER